MPRWARKPDPFHRRQVEAMAGYGVPETGIARVVGIDAKTLRKHYREKLDTGQIKATAKVAESLFRKATTDGSQSVTAAIFWLKTRGGWRESPQSHEVGIFDVSKLWRSGKTWGRHRLLSLTHSDYFIDPKMGTTLDESAGSVAGRGRSGLGGRSWPPLSGDRGFRRTQESGIRDSVEVIGAKPDRQAFTLSNALVLEFRHQVCLAPCKRTSDL